MTEFTWLLSDFIKTLSPSDKVFYANGCSMVYGAELGGAEKDGWGWCKDRSDDYNHYRVNNAYPGLFRSSVFPAHKYFNASKPGASNDRILRTSIDDVCQLLDFGIKPENLFVLVGWTQGMRFEIYDRDGSEYCDIIPGAKTHSTEFHSELGEIHLTKLNGMTTLARKTNHQIISLQSFLKINQIDYLFCNSLDLYTWFDDEDEPKSLTSYRHIDMDKYACVTEQLLNTLEFADSFNTTCKQLKIKIGSAHHPLEEGHIMWSKMLIDHYSSR